MSRANVAVGALLMAESLTLGCGSNTQQDPLAPIVEVQPETALSTPTENAETDDGTNNGQKDIADRAANAWQKCADVYHADGDGSLDRICRTADLRAQNCSETTCDDVTKKIDELAKGIRSCAEAYTLTPQKPGKDLDARTIAVQGRELYYGAHGLVSSFPECFDNKTPEDVLPTPPPYPENTN